MSSSRGSRLSVTTKRSKKSKASREQQHQFVEAEASQQNTQTHMEKYRNILREMGSIKKRVDNVGCVTNCWLTIF